MRTKVAQTLSEEKKIEKTTRADSQIDHKTTERKTMKY